MNTGTGTPSTWVGRSTSSSGLCSCSTRHGSMRNAHSSSCVRPMPRSPCDHFTAGRPLIGLIRVSGTPTVKVKRLRAVADTIIEAGGLDAFMSLPDAELRERLLATHGVGAETADAIMLYASHRRTFVIDAYTRRLFARLGLGPDERAPYETWRRWFEDGLPDADATDVPAPPRVHCAARKGAVPSSPALRALSAGRALCVWSSRRAIAARRAGGSRRASRPSSISRKPTVPSRRVRLRGNVGLPGFTSSTPRIFSTSGTCVSPCTKHVDAAAEVVLHDRLERAVRRPLGQRRVVHQADAQAVGVDRLHGLHARILGADGRPPPPSSPLPRTASTGTPQRSSSQSSTSIDVQVAGVQDQVDVAQRVVRLVPERACLRVVRVADEADARGHGFDE